MWANRIYYLLLVLFALLVGAVYRMIRNLQQKTMWRGPQLPTEEEPTDLPNYFVYKKLDTVIGTSHIAVYVPSKPRKFLPWVLYTHGVMSHCEQMLDKFNLFGNQANWVLWDYRGFGRSTGRADRLICNYDLYAVLHHLRETYELDEVTLMGSSLGTNVTLNFLHEFGDRCSYINQVILCHPFYSLQDVFEHIGAPATLTYILGRMDVSHVLPEWLRKNTNRRALVLGSSEDSITPWKNVKKLCKECENDGQMQLKCTDVGGNHFSLHEIMFGEIDMWLNR